MTRRSLLVVMFWCCLHKTATGQLTETDTMKFACNISLNGNKSTGNVERSLVWVDSEMITSSHARYWVFKLQAGYRYGTVRTIRTENDAILNSYIYYKPSNRFYPYLMMLYENNLIKTINHRIGGGPGVTCKVLKTRAIILKLSATLFFDRTIYARPSYVSERARIDTFRPTFRAYQWYRILKNVVVFCEFIDQISVSGKGDQRIYVTGGLNLQLSPVVSFLSRVTYTHDDIVPDGIKADNSYLTFGLNVLFKNN